MASMGSPVREGGSRGPVRAAGSSAARRAPHALLRCPGGERGPARGSAQTRGVLAQRRGQRAPGRDAALEVTACRAGTGDSSRAPKSPHAKHKRVLFAVGLTQLSFPRKGPRLLACPQQPQDVVSLRAARCPVSAGCGQRACSGKGPAAAPHRQPAATPLRGNSSLAILLGRDYVINNSRIVTLYH